MKVVMLAAGIGTRLGQTTAETIPKVLLRFGGKTLLERHIDIFQRQGISELVIGVGFHHDDIQREIETRAPVRRSSRTGEKTLVSSTRSGRYRSSAGLRCA